MPRPRIHDDALRHRLLVLAGQELSARGLDGLSLRALAQSAGTTTRAIYSLFGSKTGLLDAVFDEAFARFAAHLHQVEATDDPREDVIRLGHAYRASALAEPHFYPIMFGSTAPELRPSPEVRKRTKETFEPLRQAVERAVRDGQLRSEEPARIATALWAVVHGLVSLELGGQLRLADPAELFDTSMRAAVTGWSSSSDPA